MIELRWLLTPLFRMDEGRSVEIDRQLQFRHVREWKVNEHGHVTGEIVWTEWQEVPEAHYESSPQRGTE